jgi:hypothetical protein
MEVHTGLDVFRRLGHDHVAGGEADRALTIPVRRWHACVVGPQNPVVGHGSIGPGKWIVVSMTLEQGSCRSKRDGNLDLIGQQE